MRGSMRLMLKKSRHILMLSGGKDSTALAIYMREKVPEMEYAFCDTDKELPETYEYLTKIEYFLGKRIERLRDDRGFDHWLQVYGGYLPSSNMRWCTRMLKIKPFEKYVGDDEVMMYVGIRADEDRTAYISTKPNIKTVIPFKDDGLTIDDVHRILDESGIGLPAYYDWRTRSGCYFCFFQRRSEWVGLLDKHPDLFELAQGYEKPEAGYTWQQNESLQDIRQPDRISEILEREAERKSNAAARRRPRTLIQAFGLGDDDLGEDSGCLICHL